MPQHKHVGGFALLHGFIRAYEQEAERLGEDPFELTWTVQQMITAMSLQGQASEQQLHNFRVAKSLAGFLLQELVTEHRPLIEGWQKFSTPKNPAQAMAKILATALGIFESELDKDANAEELGRTRQQIAATL